VIKKLEKAQLYIGTVFLAVFVVTIFIQVIARYLRVMVIWRRTSDNPREVQDSTCEWGSTSPGNATTRRADRRAAGNSDLF